MEIAVDQRERHNQCEPEPEREDDERRQRAGPMKIGDREPQFDVRGARKLLRGSHDERRGAAQQGESRQATRR